MIKLFVGGFPPETQELELVQLLSTFGQVSTIQIVRDKISRKSKGYAFIEMTDQTGADTVIENLDATEFKGGSLSIRFAIPKNEGKAFVKFNRPAAQDHTRVKRPRKI